MPAPIRAIARLCALFAAASPALADILGGPPPVGVAPAPTSAAAIGPETHPETRPVPRREPAAASAKAAAPPDLLDRVRAGFTLSVPTDRRVQQELEWYRRHPDYLDRVFTRASSYLPFIAGEIERRRLPLELALLPVVESAYDPFAYSHGRAAGLWQIIPGTGRRFGLKQNWWYDGRRDIVESTRAALDYLEYLARLFDGDWELAIAAYNSGEGNVARAVRRNRAAGKPTDFWHLRLPRETSVYVPRLLALSRLVAEPQAFGIQLPAVPDAPRFAVVEIGSQLDLALAAELAAIDIEELYALNPGLNRWATDPAGPHRLTVPADAVELFTERLAAVPASERVRWQRHTVRNGETLSQIAERYGTTQAAIRSANGLRGNLIRAGGHLLIPVASRPLADYSLSADARLARLQERHSNGDSLEHTVASGESFWTISRKYGVGVRQLARWNGMAPGDTLSVGRRLIVKNPSRRPALATAPAAPSRLRKVRYTVRSGDSLSLIAARFRVTVGEITRWNGINASSILRPGQRLTMYVDVTQQSS